MKNLLAPIFLAATLGFALPAQAETMPVVVKEIVAQLEHQGYRQIKVNRTWLGRVRIVSVLDRAEREIVINPTTGEILRDYQADLQRTAEGGASNATADRTPTSLGAEVGNVSEPGGIIDRSGTVDGSVADPSVGVSE